MKGGFSSWSNANFEIETINRITASQFESQLSIEKDKIIDIRKMTEYEAQHVENAYNRPLSAINDWIRNVNPNEHFYMYCAGGYRSMIAASILKSRNFYNFTEIAGGFNAIANTNVLTSNFICQTKI